MGRLLLFHSFNDSQGFPLILDLILASCIFKALSFIWHVATDSWNLVSPLSHPHHIKLIVIVSNKWCYLFAHISLMVTFLSPSTFSLHHVSPQSDSSSWRPIIGSGDVYLEVLSLLQFHLFLSFFPSFTPYFLLHFFFPFPSLPCIFLRHTGKDHSPFFLLSCFFKKITNLLLSFKIMTEQL